MSLSLAVIARALAPVAIRNILLETDSHACLRRLGMTVAFNFMTEGRWPSLFLHFIGSVEAQQVDAGLQDVLCQTNQGDVASLQFLVLLL